MAAKYEIGSEAAGLSAATMLAGKVFIVGLFHGSFATMQLERPAHRRLITIGRSKSSLYKSGCCGTRSADKLDESDRHSLTTTSHYNFDFPLPSSSACLIYLCTLAQPSSP